MSYHGDLEKKAIMEKRRTEDDEEQDGELDTGKYYNFFRNLKAFYFRILTIILSICTLNKSVISNSNLVILKQIFDSWRSVRINGIIIIQCRS